MRQKGVVIIILVWFSPSAKRTTQNLKLAMATKMLVKLLLLLMVFEVLLISVSEAWRRRRRRSPPPPPPCDSSVPSSVAWSNSWHGSFSAYCPKGFSIKYWRSEHRDCKDDRIHYFLCGYVTISDQYCVWSSHYVNDYDRPVNFHCPHNGFITGVRSEYSGLHRDRRFNFRCCHVNGIIAHSCQTTPYQNNWDKEIRYLVPNGYFLVGVHSVHDDSYQDRRYKFQICKLSWVSGK